MRYLEKLNLFIKDIINDYIINISSLGRAGNIEDILISSLGRAGNIEDILISSY
jgi:hypothetical protein